MSVRNQSKVACEIEALDSALNIESIHSGKFN